MKKIAVLIVAIVLSACGSKGNEYLGKWQEAGKSSLIVIEPNGDGFLVHGENSAKPGIAEGPPQAGVLKDGAIVIQGQISAPTITYVKATDSLILSTFIGSAQLRRAK
jgi:hypothetical protein